ncbi:hypothetical protein AALB64_13575 [Lachnospiraceae bacterium 45-P1]
MSYQFSRREKILLYILAVLILTVGGFGLLLRPAMDRRLSLAVMWEEEILRKQDMEELFARKEFLENQEAEMKEKVMMLASSFYRDMDTEELGNLVISMLDDEGLMACNMEVSKIPYGESGFGVIVGIVTGEAAGSRKSIENFIDATAERPTMRMKSFTVSNGETSDGGRMKYEMEIYMLRAEAGE